MTKYVADSVLNAPLDKIIAEADKVFLLNAFTSDFATADNAANKIAEYPIGTITKANGDTSGRKGTVPLKTGVNVLIDETFAHIAVVNTVGTEVLFVTSGTNKPLTTGDKVDVPAFDIEFGDAT